MIQSIRVQHIGMSRRAVLKAAEKRASMLYYERSQNRSMSAEAMTKLFISHSSKDNEFAKQLARALTEVGMDVWIDVADIPAGARWNDAIQDGLKACDAMIVIITPDSMGSENVGDEWLYYHQRGKKIFTVLWKPTDDVHFQLEPIQYVNFHQKEFVGAFEQLCVELERQKVEFTSPRGFLHAFRSDELALATPYVTRVEDFLPEPFEWIEVPEGRVQIEDASHHTSPPGTTGGVFEVSDFFIAKYPIANAQYQLFIDMPHGYNNPEWWDYSKSARSWRKHHPVPEKPEFTGEDHPRTDVTWFEAVAFCRWLSAQLVRVGTQETSPLQITLPTEQQWQRAAIPNHGKWHYPWGDEFDENKCNISYEGTTPVTKYPEGASIYGVMDMSGNVHEMCLNDWQSGDCDITTRTYRVTRGGSWGSSKEAVQVTSRWRNWIDNFNTDFGFRIVMNIPNEENHF